MSLPFTFFFTAAESNYTVDQSLFPSRDVSPTEATSDLSKWTNEAMNHCLSKTDDGERAECILGVLLLLVQAAKVDGRQLDISTCRSIHPSLKTFLSVIGQTSLPGIKGITEDLSDKLAPRIAFAEIMKRHTDSRLSQLGKCECLMTYMYFNMMHSQYNISLTTYFDHWECGWFLYFGGISGRKVNLVRPCFDDHHVCILLSSMLCTQCACMSSLLTQLF